VAEPESAARLIGGGLDLREGATLALLELVEITRRSLVFGQPCWDIDTTRGPTSSSSMSVRVVLRSSDDFLIFGISRGSGTGETASVDTLAIDNACKRATRWGRMSNPHGSEMKLNTAVRRLIVVARRGFDNAFLTCVSTALRAVRASLSIS
jgi:hypothetical protein